MSKNSIHGHYNQTKIWQEWMKRGGDKDEKKKGMERLKREQEEEKRKNS